MSDFRFEQLDIWKESIELGNKLFDFAERAEQLRKYRFAEQLNGASMSISNNIAEGSGSNSHKEFARYLNISRDSLFECVNILHIYENRQIITMEERVTLYPDMLKLSKKIFNFRKNLL
ncbi:MAG: four helix bundle protein [Bacteroidia bacterium]